MTDQNNKQNFDSLLGSDDTIVPTSSPPDFQLLTKRVAITRRRRRLIRSATASCAVAVCAFAFLTWQQSSELDGAPQDLVTDVSNQDVELIAAANAPTPHGPDAKDIPAATNELPRIQLFASVSQSLPVFDFDEQSKSIQHVGWVESQREVPVDMKYVPNNQQETFNAVLNEQGDWKISL